MKASRETDDWLMRSCCRPPSTACSFPGQMVPSDGHGDRDCGYSADVAAILASEQPLN